MNRVSMKTFKKIWNFFWYDLFIIGVVAWFGVMIYQIGVLHKEMTNNQLFLSIFFATIYLDRKNNTKLKL